MKHKPHQAITIVDNHDTQPRHGHMSFIERWFKPQAYALILTREEGTPCIFYGDLFGLPNAGYQGIENELKKLMYLRQHCSYGKQHEFLYNETCIGWSREGIAPVDHLRHTGCAVLISSGFSQKQMMYVGGHHAGERWVDIMGNQKNHIIVPSSGWIECSVGYQSLSVWAHEEHAIHAPSGEMSIPMANTMGIIYEKPHHFAEQVTLCFRLSDSTEWYRKPMHQREDGSWFVKVNLHDALGMEFAFADDHGMWDNKNGENYFTYSGLILIKDQQLIRKDDLTTY